MTIPSGDPSDDAVLASLAARLEAAERALALEAEARQRAEAMAGERLDELAASRARFDLLQRIASAANQSGSVDEAFRFAIYEICRHTGWAFGNAYRCVGEDPGKLVPTGIWHADDPAAFESFIQLSQSMTFASGEGLPGRVLMDPRPFWVIDISVPDNSPRASVANASGLHAAFAFPVMAGTSVGAVLEFFARDMLAPDESLLALMGQVGTQLGRVIERKRAEDKLIHDAHHDPLTGLPNRALYVDRLTKALRRTRRDPDNQFATIFLDLDGFKLVNDSLGHATGDRVLKEVASRLRTTLSEAESLAEATGRHWPRWILSRMGGDEFTVLLDDMASPAQALEIAALLHRCLADPCIVDTQSVFIAASIGIAQGDRSYIAVGDIMRDADLAMYEAKAEGRSRTAVFSHKLRREAEVRLQTENDLRRSIEDKQFVLHYQPIVDLETTAVQGFEALVRWEREPGILVAPDYFIHIAEETGLIVPIGGWVLREACAAAARWHKTCGKRTALPSISINISPKQFLQPDFVAQVRAALDQSKVDPTTVRVEVTEGIAIHDPDRTATVLAELRSWGLRISLDDFGTGYSSLGYIHRLPFDTLKIDRSFVANLADDVAVQGIVQAVLDLAKTLGRDVVAEGVETEDQRCQLIAMGCRAGQGYHFGYPVDEATALRLLDRRSRKRGPDTDVAAA